MPVETAEPTFQVMYFSLSSSNEEMRDDPRIKSESVKRRIEMKHQSKVLSRKFKESNIVMRKSQINAMDNKFASKWSGSYYITEVIRNEAYQLETQDGCNIPRTWNASSLKFYFS